MSQCPLGHRCESCGAEAPALAVAEVDTAVGVVCVTLCPRCRRAIGDGTALPVTVGTAERLAAQHHNHLTGDACPAGQWSARGHVIDVGDVPPRWSASGP